MFAILLCVCGPVLPAATLPAPTASIAVQSPPQNGVAAPAPTATGRDGVWRLELAAARAMALADNLDLRIASEGVQQAHFNYMGSFGAFEWRFRAEASYTDATREVTSSFISGGNRIESTSEGLNFSFERPLRSGATFDIAFDTRTERTNAAIADSEKQSNDSLSLSFTQPLMRGRGEDVTTAAQQEERVRWEREVEVWRGQRQSTLADVDLAYWDLRAAVDAAEVQRSAVELGESLLSRRQQELQAGVGTELSVLESQADVATRKEALLAARNLRRQREDSLKSLLLGPQDLDLWEQELLPVEPYPTLRLDGQAPGPDEAQVLAPLPAWREVLAIALEQRTELRQAQSDIRLAEIGQTRALSERLAGLDLVLSANAGAVDENFAKALTDTAEWRSPTYSATLTYDLPIGNSQANAAARSAESALRSAWIQWERAQRDVLADVRTATREVHFRREALIAANQSLDLAERQLEQEEARNREGLSTNYQVLEVQQSYVEALSTQREAKAEWAKAWVGLERAKGTLDQSAEAGR